MKFGKHFKSIGGCLLAIGFLIIHGCGMSGDTESESLTEGVQSFGFIGASNLENDGFMSLDPQIAVEGDGGGTAIAVWLKQVDGNPFDDFPPIIHLYARRHNGASWISTDAACPVDGRLENNDADGICLIDVITETESADHPRVSMDDTGNAIVVWEQSDGDLRRVYARRYTAGGTWSTVVQRLNDPVEFDSLDAAGPEIAMEPDGGGTAIAAWSQAYPQQRILTWEQVVELSTDAFALEDWIGSMAEYNGFLYAGSSGNGFAEGGIWRSADGTNWSLGGGPFHGDVTYNQAESMVVFSGKLYVGMGGGNTLGDLKFYNGTSWTTLNTSNNMTGAAGEVYDVISSMAIYNGDLFLGMGAGGAEGDVYRCLAATLCDQDTDFVKVLNNQSASYERATTMAVYNGSLFVGFGLNSNGDADVWRCTGDCSVLGNWALVNNEATFNIVESMTVYNGQLYVGYGNAGSRATIRRCTLCNGADWVTVLESVTVGSPIRFWESVSAMAEFQGKLYIGTDRATTTQIAVMVCSACDGSDWQFSFSTLGYEEVSSMGLFNNGLYVGYGTTSNADADIWRLPTETVPSWVGTARRFSGGTWAISDTPECPGAGNGNSDGVCLVGNLSNALAPIIDGPMIAMDSAGRAIAAYVGVLESTGCLAAHPDAGDFSDTDQSVVSCQDTAVFTVNFNGTSWGARTDLGVNAPVAIGGGPCFLQGDATGAAGNLSDGNNPCVSAGQVSLAMDRTGNGIVIAKVVWNENEAVADNALNVCNGGQGNGDFDCNDLVHSPPGDPPAVAQDDINGNAIAAVRYNGANWGAPVFLFAQSNQPNNAAEVGGAAFFYNCPAAGRTTTETSRVLIGCDLNSPQIALSGNANGTAVAVWERFDGTNYDIFADCFTLGGNTCGAVQVTPTCTDPNLNDGWRSVSCNAAAFAGNGFATPPLGSATNDNWTAPYARLNDITLNRRAFAPKIAMDSTGNGRVVWTQKNTADQQWRIYSMQFISGTGFSVGTRQTIDGYSGGNLTFGNPVISMEWQNAGNAASCPAGVNCGSAWTLFLESDLSTLSSSSTITTMNVQARANKWIPP